MSPLQIQIEGSNLDGCSGEKVSVAFLGSSGWPRFSSVMVRAFRAVPVCGSDVSSGLGDFFGKFCTGSE